jgi:hypothetical protein
MPLKVVTCSLTTYSLYSSKKTYHIHLVVEAPSWSVESADGQPMSSWSDPLSCSSASTLKVCFLQKTLEESYGFATALQTVKQCKRTAANESATAHNLTQCNKTTCCFVQPFLTVTILILTLTVHVLSLTIHVCCSLTLQICDERFPVEQSSLYYVDIHHTDMFMFQCTAYLKVSGHCRICVHGVVNHSVVKVHMIQKPIPLCLNHDLCSCAAGGQAICSLQASDICLLSGRCADIGEFKCGKVYWLCLG